MKRLKFASAEALIQHIQEMQVNLIVEYLDESRKQRQQTLTPEQVVDVGEWLAKPESMAYYRKDGIFYEIIAEWLK